AAEHVVPPPELARALDGDDVLGLLDDADHLVAAPGVEADAAALRLGHVAAHLAELDAQLHLGERVDQPLDLLVVSGQQVERDALRALGPDAGQPAELVDQVLDRAFVHKGSAYGSPPTPRGGWYVPRVSAPEPRPGTVLTARWHRLVMLNHEIDPAVLGPLVPRGVELDTWDDGRHRVSVVGFQFLDTRLLGVPVPFHRDFDEVNLRFYVRRKGPEGWRR